MSSGQFRKFQTRLRLIRKQEEREARSGKRQRGMFTSGHEMPRRMRCGEDSASLRGLFRNHFRHHGMRGISCLRSHDLHIVPVIAEFFAAVQARDIGSGALSRRVATRTGAHRNRKTVASVPAAKHGVHQPRKHRVTSTDYSDEAGPSFRPNVETSSNSKYLDSSSEEKVRSQLIALQ